MLIKIVTAQDLALMNQMIDYSKKRVGVTWAERSTPKKSKEPQTTFISMILRTKVSIEFRLSSAFLRATVVIKIVMRLIIGTIISLFSQKKVDTVIL